MNKLKKLLAVVLATLILAGALPLSAMATEDDYSFVESITVESITIVENCNGYDRSVYLDGVYAGSYYHYYDGNLNPYYTVTFTDGTQQRTNGSFHYNGEWYYPTITSNQSFDNQWGIGAHTATFELFGQTVDYTVNIEENPIESISIQPVNVYEGLDSRSQSYWDYDLQQYVQWNYYDVGYPTYTIKFKNGVTDTYSSGFSYKNMYYYPSITTNQSYTNQWGIGAHTTTLKIFGQESNFTVYVSENPVQSVSVDKITIIENTGGYSRNGYDEALGQYVDWYEYDIEPTFTVTFKDGRTETTSRYISFNGSYYYCSVTDDQSITNPWGLGTHEYNLEIMGFETTGELEIIENPVVDVVANDVEADEYLDGYWETDYYSGEKYFYYYTYEPEFTVKLNDGSEIKPDDSGYVELYGERYRISYNYSFNQSSSNQFTVGENVVPFTFMGKEYTFKYIVNECPIESIEILEVEKLRELEGGYFDESGEYYYYNPNFTYEVIYKDGTSSVEIHRGYYDERYNLVEVENSQSESPWRRGQKNTFTVMFAGIECEISVEIIEGCGFDYIIQDEQVFITEYLGNEKVLTIPSEINGFPVVGIMSLGSAKWEVTEVTIPDSVKFIDDDLFSYSYVEKVNLGSGITSITDMTFVGCDNLTEVIVSEDNKNYCSIDGVLYDKAVETLICYPLAKGQSYVIPSSVKNIDVLSNAAYRDYEFTFADGSDSFVTIDGVTYNRSMTKIIFCDPGKTGEYVMPDSVTEIMGEAFMGSALTDIKISPNVTEIVYGTFLGSCLTDVTIPSSVQSIEMGAFWYCDDLENIHTDSLENWCEVEFEESPMEEAGNLYVNGELITELVVPSTVEKIGNGFEFCKSITKVTVSEGVKVIGTNSFAYCSNLKEVYLPTTLEKIGRSAFYECELDGVYITDMAAWCDVENLGNPLKYASYLYLNGNAVTEVVIPEGVTEIKSAFCGYSALQSVELPESLVHIGDNAFSQTSITEIVFPDSVKTIGDEAFDRTALTFISFGSSIESIGANAFSSTNITSLVIPSSVKFLGDDAFANCLKLANVSLGSGISEIPSSLFMFAISLKSITIPANIKNIGSFAFYCAGLEKVVLKGEIDTIGTRAFESCNISDMSFTKYAKNIGESAFADNCLTQVKLSEGVTDIAYQAFAYNINLTVFEIPDSVTSMCGTSLNGTEWYSSQTDDDIYVGSVYYEYRGDDSVVTIKEGTTVIADYAFDDCYSVQSVKLPSTLKTIGAFSFGSCTGLKKLDIPASVSSIDYLAFYGCYGLSEINVHPDNQYYTVVDGVLYSKDMTELVYCPRLDTDLVVIPESVTKVHSGAFRYSCIETVKVLDKNLFMTYTQPNGTWDDYSISFGQYDKDFTRILCTSDSVAYKENRNASVYINTVLERLPDKTVYYEGDDLELDGLKLSNVYSDGYKEYLTEGYSVSNVDMSTEGIKTVEVEYNGKTFEFDIEVKSNKFPRAVIESKKVKIGDEFTVDINFANVPDVRSVGIMNINYDTDKLELINGEWLVEDALISNWNAGAQHAVLMMSQNTDLNGGLFRLTFKALEGIDISDAIVSCDIIAKQRTESGEVQQELYVYDGTISFIKAEAGDINGDDELSSKDAIYLMYHALFGNDLYPVEQDCDFDKNGTIDGDDAVYLLYHILFGEEYPL